MSDKAKPTIYEKVVAVMDALNKKGIKKEQYNDFDEYYFRGIDDVYNALGPIIAEHKVLIVPKLKSRDTQVGQTSGGKPTFVTYVNVDYEFIDAENPESIMVVPMEGEAMDRGDKSINKAMSAAYKLMVFQTFCVATVEGSADSESDQHEIDAPEPMSEDNLKAIRALLEESGTDEAAFCEWKKVDRLEDLPNTAAGGVKGALTRKINTLRIIV